MKEYINNHLKETIRALQALFLTIGGLQALFLTIGGVTGSVVNGRGSYRLCP